MPIVGLTNPEEFSFITEEELERPLRKVRSLALVWLHVEATSNSCLETHGAPVLPELEMLASNLPLCMLCLHIVRSCKWKHEYYHHSHLF